MGIWDVRAAIEAASAGQITLQIAKVDSAGAQKILSLAGWHMDGTPFAVRSAPFDGDPRTRAREIAWDLIRLHYGEKHMSAKVSGLARLMTTLGRINDGADSLASRLETACAALDGEMATTTQIVGSVEMAHTQLRDVNRLYSNGGPAGPLADSSKD